jgi:glutathione S-transferase
MAAVNPGHPDAWSCWLTRRLALAVLDRANEYLASRSGLAQRAPAQFRGEAIAFERDAAIATTAPAMSVTPAAVLQTSLTAAELADRLTISQHADGFRLELYGLSEEEGAAGMLKRDELRRILQMLQAEVAKTGWLVPSAQSQADLLAAAADPKPARH